MGARVCPGLWLRAKVSLFFLRPPVGSDLGDPVSSFESNIRKVQDVWMEEKALKNAFQTVTGNTGKFTSRQNSLRLCYYTRGGNIIDKIKQCAESAGVGKSSPGREDHNSLGK